MSCSTAVLPFTSRDPAASRKQYRKLEIREEQRNIASHSDGCRPALQRCEPVTIPTAVQSPLASPALPLLASCNNNSCRRHHELGEERPNKRIARLPSLTASTLGLRLIWAGGKSKPTPSCLITALNRHRFSGNSALLAAK